MYPMVPPPRVEKPKKSEDDFGRPRTPIAALVRAILGGTLALTAGLILLLAFILPENLAENRLAMELLRNPNVPEDARNTMRMTFGRLRALPYFLLTSASLGVLGGIMSLGRRRRWASAFLLLAAIAPTAMFAALAWVHPQGFREQSPIKTIAVLVGLPCLLLLIAGLNALLSRPRLLNVPETEDHEPLLHDDGPPLLPANDEPEIVEVELCLSVTPKRARGVTIAVALVALLYVGGFLAVALGLADRLLLGDTSVQQPLAIGDPGGLFNPPVEMPRQQQPPQPPENPGPGKLPEPDAGLAADHAARLSKRLAALKAEEKKLIMAWKPEAMGKPSLRTFQAKDFTPKQFAISPDGTTLIAHSFNEILAFDVKTGAVKWRQREDDGPQGLAIAPDSRLLATVHLQKTVLRDLADGQPRKQQLQHNLWVRTLVFAPDGRTLSGGVPLWDVATGELKQSLASDRISFEGVDFTPDGAYLIVGNQTQGNPSDVIAFDAKTGQRFSRLGNGSEGGALIRVSPAGRLLAVGRISRNEWPDGIRLIDLHSGQVRFLSEFVNPAMSMCFSPDGNLLAATSSDAFGKPVIKIWQVATGQQLRHLSASELGFGLPIAFSAGGQMLFTIKGPAIHAHAMDDLLDEARLQKIMDANNLAIDPRARIRQWASVDVNGDAISVTTMPNATDEQLAQLKNVANVTWLVIQSDKVTSAGLAVLKDLPRVTAVNLSGARNVGDAALVHVKEATQLQHLWLDSDRFSDAGLGQLGGMSKLKTLSLAGARVSDSGMAHLKNLHDLEMLGLSRTRVTDKGLAHIRGLKELNSLEISWTQVTDEGLENLAELTKLQALALDHLAGLKGTGLKHLQKLTRIADLVLVGTGLTDQGLASVAELRQILHLDLSQTGVTDDGLAWLVRLVSLRHLSLPDTIGDAGLARLKSLVSIESLAVQGDRVTDDGIAHIAELPRLNSLSLIGVKRVNGSGLDQLKKLKNLTVLALFGTGINDDGLAGIKNLRKLRNLSLPNGIGKAGLAHVAALPELETLARLRLRPTRRAPMQVNIKGSGRAYDGSAEAGPFYRMAVMVP
ncbi:MAG: hypothetical protein FJ271_19815, partial [Planctomycetes bacterium]|nr:hypothetical protein [Planctomycetota bacterium]